MRKLITIGLLLVSVSGLARAASSHIYLDVPGAVRPGSEFTARILVSSEEPLNAYGATFSYSQEFLEFAGFNDSNSIIKVWQERPKSSASGLITFAGGSFSPFKGSAGELLSLHFRAKEAGRATLGFEKAVFYAADGTGREIAPELSGGAVELSHDAPETVSESKDTEPPQLSRLSINPDPFNPSQKFLTFLVSDSESGVKEVFTRHRTFIFWDDWRPGQNPIPLSANVWAVGVRVIDQEGNVLEQVVYDYKAALLNIALPLILAAFIAVLVINRRRQTLKRYNI